MRAVLGNGRNNLQANFSDILYGSRVYIETEVGWEGGGGILMTQAIYLYAMNVRSLLQ